MANLHNYHAFRSTSGGNSGGGGCSSLYLWFLGIYLLLWLVGNLSG